jgi:hypothetical protein
VDEGPFAWTACNGAKRTRAQEARDRTLARSCRPAGGHLPFCRTDRRGDWMADEFLERHTGWNQESASLQVMTADNTRKTKPFFGLYNFRWLLKIEYFVGLYNFHWLNKKPT